MGRQQTSRPTKRVIVNIRVLANRRQHHSNGGDFKIFANKKSSRVAAPRRLVDRSETSLR